MERKIIHFDMDAFFASVEQSDNPGLKGKPVIVGGTGSRGVVATCSYEARRFGVHSAMPTFMAKKKCPGGIFLRPRHSRYAEVSGYIFHIFEKYSNLVEKLSIDEAFMDVTDNPKRPVEIAQEIKRNITKETGLTVSAGISYNKFLAKLASDWEKPDGMFIITPGMVPRILYPLKVNKVYGIGKKAADKLNSLGIFTIEDLIKLDEQRLKDLFGKQGTEIYDRVRGKDDRPVTSQREIKSLGRETTLETDSADREMLKNTLFEFCKEIAASLYDKRLYGRTVTVKIKTSSFRTITRSRSEDSYFCGIHSIHRTACKILDEVTLNEPVRLIGVTVSNLTDRPVEQLSLFNDKSAGGRTVDKLVLDLNSRFGEDTLRFGIEIKK